MAAAGGASATTAVASATQSPAPMDNAAFLSAFPNVNSGAATTAQASTDGSAAGDTSFRSLFQAGERSQPVSPGVHKLWGAAGSLTADTVASAAPATQTPATPTATAPVSAAATSQGLDLFSDPTGAFSS